MALVNSPKGTHDLIGKEALGHAYIESVLSEVATTYGFTPLITPIFESNELFARGVGDTTDIVRKEMYVFKDKGDRMMALRPEGTAGVIRSIVANKLTATNELPLKYFYSGPMFRYERPQLGRYRQFHQFGVELVGASSIYDDIETMLLATNMLDALGFSGVTLRINSLSDRATREEYKTELKAFYANHLDEVCPDCKVRFEQNPLRMLDCKVPSDVALAKIAPKISNFLKETDINDLQFAKDVLEGFGVAVTIDPSLVRGLDYYSGIVFEFSYIPTSTKDYGAIGGGGRYDKLVSELGGPDIQGVGFAFGLERLYAILEEEAKLDGVDTSEDIFVISIGEAARLDAFQLLTSLRSYGLKGIMNFSDKSFKSLFKTAEKRGAKLALILGEEEAVKNNVKIKKLDTQEQIEVSYDEVVNKTMELLGFHIHGEHEHDETCGCGHDHSHEYHEHDHECECKHEHGHDHKHECCHHENGHECECKKREEE